VRNVISGLDARAEKAQFCARFPEVSAMKRSWNWCVWVGFLLVLVGGISYPLYFARFPSLRDVPWANLGIIAVALALIAVGVTRAFRRPDAYRGKIFGSALGVLAVAFTVFFCYGVFFGTRETGASHGAPQVGQAAPDFTLPDSTNKPVNLSGMLHSSFAPNGAIGAGMGGDATAGAVLIFYRGYW
jgi:hypothetical protein